MPGRHARWLALTMTLCCCAGAGVGMAEPENDFDTRVAPILARRCLDCHSGANAKGKLDLSSRKTAFTGGEQGAAVIAGNPDESLLWERVDADEMPPKSPLSAAEKAALRAWIADGARWGSDPIDPYQVTTERRAGRDWWSLQPVQRPRTPDVRDRGLVRTPIDAFILSRQESAGLAFQDEADRVTLIRRLSFDLTGLPPTPEAIDQFVQDPAPDAYERLTDRLLASPQYGVRWARTWLDLARYGESNGFEYDEFRLSSWRYRDWVVNALNANQPYDEFARLQIAGDRVRPNDPAAIEATGFLVAGAYDTAGQNQQSAAMKAVVRNDELEDMIGTVGQTFLGLTIHCARCHDHKFDPVRQTEYYGLASALSGVRHGERDLSAIDPATIAARDRLAALSRAVSDLEAPALARLRLGQKASLAAPPRPIAAWDFDRGPEDRIGKLHVTLEAGASLTSDGLLLKGDSSGHATTPMLGRELHAKTIEAWVKLAALDQRGGGVMSVETREGARFDAIVFGEREPGRWTVGSDNFARTRDLRAPAETEAAARPIHVAITYDEDGEIQFYREGRRLGRPYQSKGPERFPGNQTHVVFGLRHSPAGRDRLLKGTIVRARLYDRALEPWELANSAASFAVVSSAAIAAELPEGQRAERVRLLTEIARIRTRLASQVRKAYAVSPRDPPTTRLLLRGNPAQPDAVIAAGGVAALRGVESRFSLPPDAPEGRRRIQLAAWITDRANPLFARVIANRLWQWHFGTGLVESSSDLGFNGGAPSHPKLLDWLASELVETGWDLKAVHRLIVTSHAYRQASGMNAQAAQRDAGNRLLWRKSPIRLEAEMVRDAMLAVSGTLDTGLGGPSFRDYEVVKAPGTPAVLYQAVDPSAPGLSRRTLYRAWARGGRNALLDAFDCPDPSTTAPRRGSTTTPLQALALMNNALVLHLADVTARRLEREAGPAAERQVDRAYKLALGRAPDAAERAEAARVVERHGAATLARALFNSNEFLYVD